MHNQNSQKALNQGQSGKNMKKQTNSDDEEMNGDWRPIHTIQLI